MIDIDLSTITSILWELYLVKKDSLHKSDINSCELLPSYNTCMRRGLVLNKLNAEFSERFYYLNPVKCKECEEVIPYHKRYNSEFCSRSCSAKFHNARRSEQANDGKGYSVNCLCCGELISDTYTKRKYCDQKCWTEYNLELRFRDWYEFGRYFDNGPIRKFLTIWKGYQCEHCGISDWNGRKITLEVEHINGNSEDSSPENVCLLCPNCHSQTPTYKARNIGNGRHARRLRYQEGKSY